jgi:heterodisulfide reductase subunit D
MNSPMTGAPQTETFESALKARADTMADACTRCGKCVEVCPATEAAGLTPAERQNPVEVISGIIDIIRTGEGNDAARKWASGCLLSGECIKACDYGVNPRFLLYMARIAMSHANKDTAAERRAGFDAFRLVGRDVPHISKIQLVRSRVPPIPSRTLSFTPAAMCSRPRTLRCSRSTSWTRSTSLMT